MGVFFCFFLTRPVCRPNSILEKENFRVKKKITRISLHGEKLIKWNSILEKETFSVKKIARIILLGEKLKTRERKCNFKRI